jgi:hypothetical protein
LPPPHQPPSSPPPPQQQQQHPQPPQPQQPADGPLPGHKRKAAVAFGSTAPAAQEPTTNPAAEAGSSAEGQHGGAAALPAVPDSAWDALNLLKPLLRDCGVTTDEVGFHTRHVVLHGEWSCG